MSQIDDEDGSDYINANFVPVSISFSCFGVPCWRLCFDLFKGTMGRGGEGRGGEGRGGENILEIANYPHCTVFQSPLFNMAAMVSCVLPYFGS